MNTFAIVSYILKFNIYLMVLFHAETLRSELGSITILNYNYNLSYHTSITIKLQLQLNFENQLQLNYNNIFEIQLQL